MAAAIIRDLSSVEWLPNKRMEPARLRSRAARLIRGGLIDHSEAGRPLRDDDWSNSMCVTRVGRRRLFLTAQLVRRFVAPVSLALVLSACGGSGNPSGPSGCADETIFSDSDRTGSFTVPLGGSGTDSNLLNFGGTFGNFQPTSHTVERIKVKLETQATCPADLTVEVRASTGHVARLWNQEGECMPRASVARDRYVLFERETTAFQAVDITRGAFFSLWVTSSGRTENFVLPNGSTSSVVFWHESKITEKTILPCRK